MKEWTAQEVWDRLKKGEKLRIVDVREPGEFASGHIPGAELISMGRIPSSLNLFDKDEQVIFVCRSGGRSYQVSSYMDSSGFKNVINMQGGMLAWPGEVE